MRLGTYLPFAGPGGVPFDAHEVAVRARRVEAAGFDGVWVGDGSYRRIAPWPDPQHAAASALPWAVDALGSVPEDQRGSRPG